MNVCLQMLSMTVHEHVHLKQLTTVGYSYTCIVSYVYIVIRHIFDILSASNRDASILPKKLLDNKKAETKQNAAIKGAN